MLEIQVIFLAGSEWIGTEKACCDLIIMLIIQQQLYNGDEQRDLWNHERAKLEHHDEKETTYMKVSNSHSA